MTGDDTGVNCVRMTVAPQLAASWLEKNTNNRPLNKSRVDLFRSNIRCHTFALTHQGVAFYGDFEQLADGQHRLAAIAAEGQSVDMFVTWGLTREAVHAIDQGRTRSVTDILNFQGMDMTPNHTAACRAMWQEYHAVRTGTSWAGTAVDAKLFSVFCSHVREAVEFAMPSWRKRGLSHATVTAAIASAWFTADRTRLSRFKDLLQSGTGSSDTESAAIALRDYMMSKNVSGGTGVRQELYLRASTALRAFLERRGISKLYCRAEARFPIPDCPGI